MTYTDIGLQLASNSSVVHATGTFLVGDVIDLNEYNNAATRIGDDNSLWVRVRCRTQMLTGGTTGSVRFHLVSDANPSLNAAGTGNPVLAECTTHLSSLTIVTDDDNDLETGIAAGTATFLPNQSYGQTVAAGTPGHITGEYLGRTQTAIIEAWLPRDVYERYLGLIVVVATAATTAGTVDGHLVHDIRNMFSYPNAI